MRAYTSFLLPYRRRHWEEVKVLCGAASVSPLATLLSRACLPRLDECATLLICGGNTDPALLRSDAG